MWTDPRAPVFLHIFKQTLSLSNCGLKWFVLEHVHGLAIKHNGERSPLDMIFGKLRSKLPTGWQLTVRHINSWCTAQSRRQVYIIGHNVSVKCMAQPTLPRGSLTRILQRGLGNAVVERMCRSRLLKFRKHMQLLQPHLLDRSLIGRAACFSADRDPANKNVGFCTGREAAACGRTQSQLFVVSLGEGATPSICKPMHVADICMLQGTSPSNLPTEMSAA